jgi:hypothetical protein
VALHVDPFAWALQPFVMFWTLASERQCVPKDRRPYPAGTSMQPLYPVAKKLVTGRAVGLDIWKTSAGFSLQSSFGFCASTIVSGGNVSQG